MHPSKCLIDWLVAKSRQTDCCRLMHLLSLYFLCVKSVNLDGPYYLWYYGISNVEIKYSSIVRLSVLMIKIYSLTHDLTGQQTKLFGGYLWLCCHIRQGWYTDTGTKGASESETTRNDMGKMDHGWSITEHIKREPCWCFLRCTIITIMLQTATLCVI